MNRRLSGLGVTIAIGLLVLALGVQGVRTTHFGPQEAISVVFILPPLVLVPFVAFGARWSAAIAAALSAFYAIGAVTTAGELQFLSNPAFTVAYLAIVAEILGAVVVVVGGIIATVRQLQLKA
jgi:hypothetical protein